MYFYHAMRNFALRYVLAGMCVMGLATVNQAASAAGWYGGIGFGLSKFKDLDCNTSIPCSIDDDDTGFKIYGGRQLNSNAAVEFGYIDLGETTGSLASTSFSFDASGFAAALVGFLPLDKAVALTGKVGLFLWDVDAHLGPFSESESGFDPLFGVGLQFAVGKNTGIRIEWERFKIGDSDTGKSDVDLISANLVLKF